MVTQRKMGISNVITLTSQGVRIRREQSISSRQKMVTTTGPHTASSRVIKKA